ncbi:hypothetical protein HZ326_4614 [Fusarium oxysporum f. sp. albedinis]|nr:hypothetical protein HZ326_4614 [Fusarium oxysporum f. sp. albedinis]
MNREACKSGHHSPPPHKGKKTAHSFALALAEALGSGINIDLHWKRHSEGVPFRWVALLCLVWPRLFLSFSLSLSSSTIYIPLLPPPFPSWPTSLFFINNHQTIPSQDYFNFYNTTPTLQHHKTPSPTNITNMPAYEYCCQCGGMIVISTTCTACGHKQCNNCPLC